MPNFILYLLLGLGTGAAYALLANGIVTIYKGSGILNFAQGGLAMFAMYVYTGLLDGGVSKWIALIIVIIGSFAGGAVIAVVIIRPLRSAPALAKVVATLGLLLGLEGLATVIWGSDGRFVPSLFPTTALVLPGGAHLGVDRLLMLATAIVCSALLWAGFRFTRFGLATQASSENERGAALLGFSPTVVAAVNWGLGTALAALAGALIAPLTGLDTATLPLIVLPALAAALVGRFSSFGITTAVAVLIGCAESVLFFSWSQPGVETAAPFLLVMLVMFIAGRGLPTRGAVSEGRPPGAAAGRVRIVTLVLCVGVAVLLFALFNTTYKGAFATSLTTAVLALSLVVVTGYVGQVSLMQMTFAGLGGFVTAKMAFNLGVPFPLSMVVAAVIVAPVGALLGLPALRVRGMSLAVVTLGAAIAIDAVVFENPTWSGSSNGVQVPSPSLAGFSLDPFTHATRYGLFVLVVLVLVAVVVSNIRRSGTGSRMLAVRSNERAAAVAGVNVAAVKLQAFTVSAVIAAIGGGLLAYSNPYFVVGAGASGSFAAAPSITLVTIVYIGGIASVSGAIVAGLIASGGVFYVLLSGISGFENYYLLISGVGLTWTVISNPDGVAVFNQRQFERLMKKLRGRRAQAPPGQSPPGLPEASHGLAETASAQRVGVQ